MLLERELTQLQNGIALDTLRFLPEVLLCLGIFLALLARLFRFFDRFNLVSIAIPLLLFCLIFLAQDSQSGTIFREQLRLDRYAIFLRAIILSATALVLILGRITGLPDRPNSADFLTLVLGGALGMMLMVSANSLLMVFVAVEMASLPSYVLAGFQKQKSHSSEAALKYVVYGAAASGVMLYGISLLAGRCGSADLTTVGQFSNTVLITEGFDLPLSMGYLFFAVGLAFKLSAVPFQFWLPDVFHGAMAEVGAILAVTSKIAAFGLLLRLIHHMMGATTAVASTEAVAIVIATVGMLTTLVGNLAALVQTNLKRILAYSTIAHAGYILMAVSCLSPASQSAILFYFVGYLPMTLGAFAVVAILRNQTGSEDVEASRGLLKRAPWVAVPFAIFLFSLLGLPPLVGFAGKFQIFAELYQSASDHRYTWRGIWLFGTLAVGLLSTVIGAGYYLKILKIMAMEDPQEVDEKGNAQPLQEPLSMRLYLGLLAAIVVLLGIAWDPLLRLTQSAIKGLGP
jgi:NADH-quinone oxidoreductase subunit N